MIDYTITDSPYFAINQSDFPSQEQQLIFIRSYLEVTSKHHSIRDMKEEEQALLKEVCQFVPMSHFLWAVWSLLQAKSDIQFGHKEYAFQRLQAYKSAKEHLLHQPRQ